MSLISIYIIQKNFVKIKLEKLCNEIELKTYFIYANIVISLYATDLSLLGLLSISFLFLFNAEFYLKSIFRFSSPYCGIGARTLLDSD